MSNSQLHRARQSHRRAFFRNWLQDPFNVASIAPSGKSLARLMASGLHSGATVVELGAGTGTLTEAILERGVRPENLYLIERCEAFVEILRARFPAAHVVGCDAEACSTYLPALVGNVDYVISGLPITWFSREKKTRILDEAFTLLRPNGCYQQFTYLGRSPVGNRILGELGLRTSLLGITPINLPPAFVYRFERNGAAQQAAA